jgi:antitoxin (DNA-binding transcriptional repressor) of toxin-antitoxin stability system
MRAHDLEQPRQVLRVVRIHEELVAKLVAHPRRVLVRVAGGEQLVEDRVRERASEKFLAPIDAVVILHLAVDGRDQRATEETLLGAELPDIGVHRHGSGGVSDVAGEIRVEADAVLPRQAALVLLDHARQLVLVRRVDHPEHGVDGHALAEAGCDGHHAGLDEVACPRLEPVARLAPARSLLRRFDLVVDLRQHARVEDLHAQDGDTGLKFLCCVLPCCGSKQACSVAGLQGACHGHGSESLSACARGISPCTGQGWPVCRSSACQ